MAGFPGWSAGAGQPWIQPGYQPQLPPEPPPPLPDEQPPPLPPGAAPQATLHQATHFPPVQSTPNFSQSTGQPNFPSLPVQYTFPGGYPQMQHAAQAYYPQAAPGPAGAPTTFPAPGQPSYPMNMTPMHLQATLPQQSPPFFWDGFQWVPTPAPAVQPVQQHWHPGALGVPAPGAAHQQPAWGHTGAVGPVLTSTGASDVSKLLQPLVVTVDAARIIFSHERATRPQRIAVIVRGIPGSGKSRIAKALRDAEVSAGGEARILSLDDYFMTEVEKEVAEDPAGGGRARRRVERCMVYEHDPAMEAAYASQLLRAFRRAVEDPAPAQRFRFVIVDAPVLTCKELSTFLELAAGAGYEAFVAQPGDGDMAPELCAQRGVHGRSLEEVRAAAARWEPTPVAAARLDVAALLPGGLGQPGSRAEPGPGPTAAAAAAAASPSAPPPAPSAGPAGSRWASLGDDNGDSSAATSSSSGRGAAAGPGASSELGASSGADPRGQDPDRVGDGDGGSGGVQSRRKRKRKTVSWNESVLELIRVVPGLGPRPGDGEVTAPGAAPRPSAGVPFWAAHGSSGTAGPLGAAADVLFVPGGSFADKVRAERRVAKEAVGHHEPEDIVEDDL